MSIVSNTVKKYGYVYLFVLVIMAMHIGFMKNAFEKQLALDVEKNLKQQYHLYKKIYKTSSNVKSFLIENEDFVSNVEMVDLLSKSSPFYVNKKEKMPNKFSLVFAFLSKEEIKNNIHKCLKKSTF